MKISRRQQRLQQTSFKIQNGPFSIQRDTNHHLGFQIKTDSWKSQQTAKYMACIQHFSKQLETQSAKQLWNVYKRMASFVRTRNPNQCRIYHHHMLKTYGSLEEIILSLGVKRDILKNRSKLFLEKLGAVEMEKESNLVGMTDIQRWNLQAISSKNYKPVKQNKELPEQIEESQIEQEVDIKKNDQNQIRTDITYHDDQQPHHHQNHKRKNENTKNYNNFCQSQQNAETNNYTGYYPYYQHFNFPFNCPLQPIKRKQVEWMECHQLYLAWTQKLFKLMQSQ